MAFPGRRAQSRLGLFSSYSLVKTWGMLLMLALVLVMIDFRFVWRQMDSPVSNNDDIVQVRLRDGYSHTLLDAVDLQPRPPERSALKHLKLDLDSLLFKDPDSESRLLKDHEDFVPGNRNSSDLVLESNLEKEKDARREKAGREDAAHSLGDEKGKREPVKKVVSSNTVSLNVTEVTEEFLRYLRVLKLKAYSRWIVLDVTSGKCEEKVKAPSGWMILSTGETATFKGCSSPGCIHLPSELNISAKAEHRSNSGTSPSPTFMKNLAYLAAMSHGAQFILDADCSVSLEDATRVLQFKTRMDHGPLYNETQLFNPYAHFGAWATSPRAVVLESSSAGAKVTPGTMPQNSRLYYVRDFNANVLAKHGVGDMSLDATVVGGGTRDGRDAAGKMAAGSSFDSSVPPVFVGQKSFSPAVPACSLYRQTAFWSLLLPCRASNTLRCHVLRQLIQQRLFRELDAFSGFYQVKIRASGDSMPVDITSSQYTGEPVRMNTLISALDAWTCQRQATFFDCVDNLSDYLFREKRLSQAEHVHMKSWIKVLAKIGAAQPARVSTTWRGVRKTSEVRVTLGSVKVRLEGGGAKEEQILRSRFADNIVTRCNSTSGSKGWFPVAQWLKPVIEDVVLIVVFNWNKFFWNNLPFTEIIHRPFFKHIIYCVPNMEALLKEDKEGILRHVSFVEGLSDSWYFMYECVTIVAQMNIQGVRGYLQIGDDTLTNTWKYFSAPRDSMWIPQGFTTMRIDEVSHRWGWYWWKKSRGRPATLQAMADLEQISGLAPEELLKLDPNYSKLKSSQHPVTTFHENYSKGKSLFPRMRPVLPGSDLWEVPSKEEAVKFMKNYYGANRLSGSVRHRALDFFYIPQTLIDGWVKFSHHFLRRNVLIELAVPAIHYGLAPKSDVKYVSATSLWRRDRSVTYNFYDESIFFLHPFKMKANMDSTEGRDFFCNDYMDTLFTELAKQTKPRKS